MDHGTKHAVQLVHSDLLRVDRVHHPARRIFELDRPHDQLGHPPSWTGMAKLDRQHDQLGGWLAGSNTRPARPSAEMDQFSSPDGRAGSNTRPARPSAELDQSSLAYGRAISNTRPARPFAELDRILDQLGHPPSWTSPVRWMAELERSCFLHPVLAAPFFRSRTKLLLFHLDRSHRWNFTI
ncbi:hypothetical protein DY000_02007061 [Brassica cretica]|uniref:Uncharacterized protein n=1 Tax=Brassica cretica TaxID=69181 RepID=A0ABQ7BS44_BRACR|nr:hypothetical protein DY000_02007061 [Brassica cretica]